LLRWGYHSHKPPLVSECAAALRQNCGHFAK
jgi:hypothetical protein